MKAVIVDVCRKTAAALDENGQVIRIHNANYEIGQTIELYEAKTDRKNKRFRSGVAAALLVAMIGTGTAYALPYGTVTLGEDSAIEYTINCFDYVLDVKATNAEGEAMLSEVDTNRLRHHRIDSAVAATVEYLDQSGYLDQEDEAVCVKAEARNENHSEQLQQELARVVESERGIPEPGDGTVHPEPIKNGSPAGQMQIPTGISP